MKRLLLLGLLSVAGCAPQLSATPSELPITALSGVAAAELSGGFQDVLGRLGVRVDRTSAFAYEGESSGAFEQALSRFYRSNPGFCPLTNAFHARGEDLVYVTLVAKEREVRGFVYDQSRRPRLRFAYLEGWSAEVLPTVACSTQR